MMTLTSLGAVPTSLALSFPSGMVELMVATLVVSGLGIVAAALGRQLRAGRGHDAGRLLSPVARQTLPA